MERTMTRRIQDSTKIKIWRVTTLVLAALASWGLWYLLVPENENVLVYVMVISFMTTAALDMFSEIMQNHWYEEYLLSEDTDDKLKSFTDGLGITSIILMAGLRLGWFERLADWICSMI